LTGISSKYLNTARLQSTYIIPEEAVGKKKAKKKIPEKNPKKKLTKDKGYPIVEKGKGRTGGKTVSITNLIGDKAQVTMTIQTTYTGWKMLDRHFSNIGNDKFAYDMYFSYIFPALEGFERKKSELDNLIDNIKKDAARFYVFFSFWCRRSTKGWPDYLANLINLAKKENQHELLINPKGKIGATELTAFCLQKYYSIRIRGRLKPFLEPGERDGAKNFYITYIHDKDRLSLAKKLYIIKKNKEEIINLAYRPPYKRIFSFLKVM
jgi:hypothetical protein